MNSKTLNYELRIIAFIDILGFKEIVKQSGTDTTKIELLFSVLEYLKDWETSDRWDLKYLQIEEDAQKKGVNNFDIRGKTNSTSFSDSIVISVKISNNINAMVSTLVVNLSYIGAILMEKGILFRGGLTIGNIIHNDNGTVFGQGLIDAFLLETRSAKYPRIILSDKLIKHLKYPLEAKRDRYPYHHYLNRFEDGCVGFHQMIHYQVIESWSEMTDEKLKANLESARKTIIDGLDSSFEKPEVFEKYKWLQDQYDKLIILKDFDMVTKTYGNVKRRISDVKNHSHVIHFRDANNS